jgi:glucose-6-phosphate 1-epimerase
MQGTAPLPLTTGHGKLVIALHGAHVLSWLPTDQRDVF